MFGLALLVACGLYVWLALFVAKQVGTRTDSRLAKYAVLAGFALVFTWDVIPGHLYHQYLCQTESGVQVFKVVEVGREHFLPNGKPNMDSLADRYAQPSSFDRKFSPLFHIVKFEMAIQDKESGEVLGKGTDFQYRGGWFSRFLFVEGGSSSCPEYPHLSIYEAVSREVLRSKSSSVQGGH